MFLDRLLIGTIIKKDYYTEKKNPTKTSYILVRKYKRNYEYNMIYLRMKT